MTDSRAFLERLAKVPTHVMLTPGVHLWRDNDYEIQVGNIGQGRELFHDIAHPTQFGKIIESDSAYRPVPEHIRRSAAWWGLYNSLATSNAGARFEYDPHDKAWPLSTYLDSIVRGVKGFGSREALKKYIPILGGEKTIIHYLSEGPLLDGWVGEQ